MNEVLDESEVAKLLDCEPRTVQEKARTGQLPAIKFGRSWRFPKDALLQALNNLAIANRTSNRTQAIATYAPTKPRRRPLPKLVEM